MPSKQADSSGGPDNSLGTLPKDPPAPSVDVTQTLRWMKMDHRLASPADAILMNNMACVMASVRKTNENLEKLMYHLIGGHGITKSGSNLSRVDMPFTSDKGKQGKRKHDTGDDDSDVDSDRAPKKSKRSTRKAASDLDDAASVDVSAKRTKHEIDELGFGRWGEELWEAYNSFRGNHPDQRAYMTATKNAEKDAKEFFRFVESDYRPAPGGIGDPNDAFPLVGLRDQLNDTQKVYLYIKMGKRAKEEGKKAGPAKLAVKDNAKKKSTASGAPPGPAETEDSDEDNGDETLVDEEAGNAA